MKDEQRHIEGDHDPAWHRWSGVVLAGGLIAGLIALRRLNVPLMYPAPVIIMVQVYTALSGGLRIGTLVAVLFLTFTVVFFSEPGQLWTYSPDNLQRLIGYAVSLPVITLMVGLLKQRADQRSARLLDQSEERFRSTFEQAAVGITHIALDGRWLRVNRRVCELTGYSVDELLSKQCHDLAPPDRADEIRAVEQQLLQGDIDTFTTEQPLTRPDGSNIWISVTLSLARAADGRPAYFISVINDIADRKRVEAQLQQQANRAAVLAELSRAVTMASMDIDQVLALTIQRVAQTIGDGCAVRLVSDDNRWLSTGIEYHVNPAVRELIRDIAPIYDQPVGTGMHGRVAQTGDALLLPRMPPDQWQTLVRPEHRTYAQQYGLHSLMIVPMRVRGKVIGTLTSARDQTPAPYTLDDQRFLQDVADRAALGVVNARLFSDLQRELAERARAEAAVRESEQRYRLIARATNDVLWDWNVRTDQLVWNDAVYITFRYGTDEVASTIAWWSAALHADDRDRVVGGIMAAVASGQEFWSDEYRFRCGDGSYAVVLDRGYLVHDDRGTPTRMIGSMQDVTERTRAEQSLAAEKERLAVTLSSIGDAVITTDTTGRITLLNAAAEQLTGWTDAEAQGRMSSDVLAIVDEYRGTALPDPVPVVLRAGQAVDLFKRAVLRSRDGREHVIADSGAPLRDDADTIIGVVLVFRDITQRAQLEQQLQHAQKMESIGIMAGGIAHDFNNILTGIIGTADLLLLDLDPDHPLRPDIESIRTQGDRGAALTRQLLAFSRRQSINLQPSDLNSVVRNVERFIRRVIGPQVELRVEAAPQLAPVSADPPQIEQVLLNLCINARDAMPDGGTITIATANVELDEAFAATHVGAQPGAYVQLAVSDTGSGMSAETLQQVFEPFFTTKEPGKGTGLGLAMVYGIVQQHNGLIDVQSEPGRGTTFSLYVPALAAHTALPSPIEQPHVACPLILVIDDDEVVRTLIARVLGSCGYHVLTATDDQHARDLLVAYADQIKLVVFDPMLGWLDGSDVLPMLRAQQSTLKVLITSNHVLDVLARELADDPNADLLSRPFTPDELTRRVRALLDRAPELTGQ